MIFNIFKKKDVLDQEFLNYDIIEVKKFIKDNIKNTNIENIDTVDFKYISINNLFPTKYYNKFVKLVDISTPTFQKNKMVEGSTNKVYLDLFPKKTENKNYGQIIDYFLKDLKEIIKLIINEVYLKFDNLKLIPVHINKNDLKNFGQILIRDDKSFSINPHLHTKSEILDCLFYFPNSDADIDQGTVIYKKISDQVKVGNREGYEGFNYDNFEEAKKFTYIPNKLIAWLNNSKSFHGSNVLPAPMKENKKYIFFGMGNLNTSVKFQKNW